MDRTRKMELIQRSLALRHKLKVHESLEQPGSHEDLAVHLLAKWELEDELNAIEELLAVARRQNVNVKRDQVEAGVFGNGKKASAKKKSSSSSRRPSPEKPAEV